MRKDRSSTKTVDITISRLNERLNSFFVDLPTSSEAQNKFAIDFIEFYTHEIMKFKISVLAELEKDSMVEIEALSTKKQNDFYKKRIKERLEKSTDIDYQPELPRFPDCKSNAVKYTTGAAIGGGCGLVWLAVAPGSIGIGKVLMVLFLSIAGAVASNQIVTSVEKNNIQKLIEKYLYQEKQQLIDFSNRLSDKYIRIFEDFISRE